MGEAECGCQHLLNENGAANMCSGWRRYGLKFMLPSFLIVAVAALVVVVFDTGINKIRKERNKNGY